MKSKNKQLAVLAHGLRFKLLFFTVVALGVFFLLPSHQSRAAAGINPQLNFQGRLLDSTGAVVADGDYNMEFTIVQDGDGCNPTSGTYPCSGTVKWTETRKQSNRVTVKNGYFSVNLGSVTAFGSNVDWNQDTLWLGINIGGTTNTPTPTWDGVMKPMKRLTSSPYAFNSQQLQGLQASNFVQLAQGVQTDSSTTNASIAINKTGSTANILTLQKSGNDVFTISNTGTVLAKNSADSTTAFQVQKSSSSNSIFTVDTSNNKVLIGDGAGSTPITLSGSGGTARIDLDNNGIISAVSNLFLGGDNSWGVIVSNGTNSTGAFLVQNTNGDKLVQVDTLNNQITLGGLNSGEVNAWQTNANSLPTTMERASSVTANGYVYVIGGKFSPVDTVYYAKLNADGSTGTWQTNANTLPVALKDQSSVVANGYVYVIGGDTGSGIVDTVYYAKLNAEGSTGAWQTSANTLPNIRSVAGTAVANGYVYIVGGTDGASSADTVYYAKLNADGSTGTWQTNANTLPVSLYGLTSVVANGYVYAIGGTEWGVGGHSEIHYAQLNADGSTGVWSTNANSLSDVSSNHTSVVANGYVYVLSGCSSSCPIDTIQYAQLNADGSTGVWLTSANVLPSGVYTHTSVLANGYVYVLGGYNGGGDVDTVYYASTQKIIESGSTYSDNLIVQKGLNVQADTLLQGSTNSTTAFQIQNQTGGNLFQVDTANNQITIGGLNSGEVNAWQTNANALPQTSWGQTSIVANGYVYALGGYNGSSYLDTVYYAKLNADGSTGTWQTNAYNLPETRVYHSSAVANGYVYVIGGEKNGTPYNDNVYYAKLNADGSTGAWSSTTVLPQTMKWQSSIAANGYLYVLGGYNGTHLDTVYYARLNANGTVGTWQTNANTLPNNSYGHSTVVANGYIYTVGGGNNALTQTDVVFYAKLNADGSTGTWQTNANTLPVAENSASSVVANGYVYVLGGSNADFNSYSSIYYAKLNADGSTGIWGANTTHLPTIREYHSSAITNGYVYVMGGDDTSSAQDTVYYASTQRVTVGGSLDLVGLGGANLADAGGTGGSLTAANGTFVGSLQVQGPANFADAVSINGLLNAATDAAIGSSNSGEVKAWQTSSNSLPADRAYASSVIANGYVYVIGGSGGSVQNTVYYAKLNSDGSVGTWNITTALPDERYQHTSVVANDYVYVIGGRDSANVYKDTVYYAKLNNDGTVGAWTTSSNPLDGGWAEMSSVVANGYVYNIGGDVLSGAGADSRTYYAKLNADGSTGPWTSTTSLPGSRDLTGTVVANGYIYAIGGDYDEFYGSTNTVYYAPLNPDGSIGTWQSSPNTLPGLGIADGKSVVANGYVYLIGGSATTDYHYGDRLKDTVYYAKLNGDGTTGPWIAASNTLPVIQEGFPAVITNGYIYVLGGDIGGSFTDSVYYASTQRILVGGSLDLVGLGGSNLADAGGTGGSLTAANGIFVGSLQVQGATSLADSLSVNGNVTLGSSTDNSIGLFGIITTPVLLKNTTDSTTAFQIQDAAAAPVLNVDTTIGTTTLTGKNDQATLGAEKVTNGSFTGNATGWTLGTGWAYNSDNVTHTAGTASALEQNISAVASEYYQVTYTISGRSAGSITPEVGGSSSGQAFYINGTDTQVLRATGTGNLKLNASSDFNGTVDDVSVMKVNTSTATLSISSNGDSLEFRGGSVGFSNDTVIGHNAGFSLQSSSTENTAVGNSALQFTTSGAQNSAFGYISLQHNTSGNINSSFGDQSLSQNTIGSFNTAVGGGSLNGNRTGDNNTAIGINSGGSSQYGSNNTFAGASAGFCDSGVVFCTSASLGNATAIGYASQVQSSNSLVLGGQGPDAVNVGIGTTSPTNLFSVYPVYYSTGTASQSGTTITGAGGANWGAEVVGMEFIFANGTKRTITVRNSSTSLTVTPSGTVSSQAYRIHNPAFYVSSTGSSAIRSSANSTTAFQVQNAGGAAILTADTSNNKVTLGAAGTSGITGNLQFNFTGVTGSISLVPLTPSSTAYTLNLPAENGTLCSTGSVCSGYQAAGSYATTTLNNLGSTAINASLLPATDDTIDLGDNTHRWANLFLGGETLHIGTSTTDEGSLAYTTSSNLLTLANQASSSNSGVLVKNAADSTTAFQVQNSSGNSILGVDATNGHVSVGNSAVATAVQTWSNGAVNAATVSVAPHTTGNLMLLAVQETTGVNLTSVSGGGVTNWTRITTYSNNRKEELWKGIVTSTGSSTITVAYSGTPGTYTELASTEFSAGTNPNWSVITSGNASSSSSTTITYPTLTSTLAGQLYWGYAWDSTTAAAGSSPGFSYVVTSNSNLMTYNTNLAAATGYSPTGIMGSGNADAIAAIVSASAGTTATINGTATIGGFESSSAFQIQNSIGSNALAIDTTSLNSFLTNSSLEGTDVSAWTYSGAAGGSVARDTTQQYIGSASLKIITGTTAAAFDGVASTLNSILATSTTYTISWYDTITSGTFTDVIARFSYDGTTGNASSCTGINSQTVSTSGWTRHTCQFTTGSGGTAPTSANAIFIVQQGNNGGTQRTFYIDAVQLEQASSATAYKETGISLNGVIFSPVVFKNQSDSTTAFQVQNSSSNNLLAIDTSSNIAYLGITGSTNANSIIHIADSSAGVQTATIGSTNSTSATTIKGGTGGINLTPDGSSNTGVVVRPSNNSTHAFEVQDNSTGVVLGVDTAHSTVGIGGAADSTSKLSIGTSAFVGLTVNETGSNNILQLQQTGANVVSVTSTGATLFKNSTDSTAAFQVQNSIGTSVFNTGTVTQNNLITNSSFEGDNSTSTNGVKGWTRYSANETTFSTSSSNPQNGTQSLNVVTPATSTNDGTKYTYFFRPNTQYTFSVYAMATVGFSKFDVGANVNTSDVTCSVSGNNLTITTGLARYNCVFTTGATTTASDYLFLRRNSGDTATARTLYFDAAQLEIAGSASTYMPDPYPNMMRNSDIESNTDNWAAKASATISMSQEAAKFGSSSLKVVTTASSNTDGAAFSFPIQANKRYSLSFWARTNTGTATLQPGRQNQSGTDVDTGCSTAALTTTWTNFTCTFNTAGSTITPPTTVYLRDTTTSHTFYIDGVTLVQSGTALTYTSPALSVDLSPLTSTITINGTNSGELSSWQVNANALPAVRGFHSSVTANGYVYVIGGLASGATSESTVYYAKLNSDGSAGVWQTNANALPVVRDSHSSIVANGYVYVIGGSNNGSYESTVYYAKLNADGSTGAWQTNANALPAVRQLHSSVVANGYVYVIGGIASGTTQSTVYYAKLNADGSTGAWKTNAYAIGCATPGCGSPAARSYHSSVVANGYVYVIGGNNGSADQSSVYYARLNTDGSTGAWSTNANALPDLRADHSSVVADGYVYVIGGYNNITPQSTVYYARLNTDGSTGAWSTNANALPDARARHPSFIANGYVYVIGGNNNSAYQSTVYYASTPRVLVGGNLDLVGLSGQDLTNGGDFSQGSTGGTLTAGNTTIVGSLQVAGQANFNNNVGINGSLTINGSQLVKATQNSTNFLQIQNGSGVNVLNINTVNLIANSDFETGTAAASQIPDGWAVKGTLATISVDNTQFDFGSNSMKVVTSTNANEGAKFSYSFLASTQYTFSFYARTSAGSYNITPGRQDNITNGEIDCSAAALTTTWTRFSCTFTTNATINTSYLYFKDTGTSHTFFIDGVQLETAAAASTYREGDLNINGNVTVKNYNDSATAFLVQNAAGSNYIAVDTSGANLNLGTSAIAETVQIGINGTNTSNTQTINIGNQAAAGTTNVTLGAFTGATAGDTTLQAFGTLTLQTAASGTISIGTNAVNKTINIGSASSTSAVTITSGVTTGTGSGSAFVFSDTALTSGSGVKVTLANPQVNANSGVLTSGSIIDISSANHDYLTLTNSDLNIGGHANNFSGPGSTLASFVYNTAGDVDGGRWTNDDRAQNSSWYKETKDHTGAACVINTDDRCGQSTFPRIAAVYATASHVYIFDAKDNSLWMDFTQGTTALGADSNNDPSSVWALNGQVFVGTNGSSGTGLYVIDFVRDKITRYDKTDARDFSTGTNATGSIANRNGSSTYLNQSRTGMKLTTTGTTTVNDVKANMVNGKTYIAVAMGAAADTTTQLTAGNVALIDETDQSVAFFTATAATFQSKQVFLTSTGSLYWTNGAAGSPTNFYLKVKYNAMASSGNNNAPDEIYGQSSTSNYGTAVADAATPTFTAGPTTYDASTVPSSLYVSSGTSLADGKSDTIYMGTADNLTVINAKRGDPTNGLVKYYTKDYITADLTGDTRAYYPLDTDFGSGLNSASVVKTVSASLSNGGTSPTYATSGVRGQAGNYSATTSASFETTASSPTFIQPTTAGLTVHGWVQPTAVVTTNATLRTWVTADDAVANKPDWGFGTVGDGTNANITCWGTDTTGTPALTTINTNIPAVNNTWYHVAETITTGGAISCYVNGILAGTGQLTNNTGRTPTRFSIGATSATTALSSVIGNVDEVYVTAEVASAARIRNVYDIGYRTLNSHGSQTLRATTVTADNSNQFFGSSSNTITTVWPYPEEGVIYVGTSTGGLYQFGRYADAINDLITTTATDDVGTALGNNNVNAVSVGKGYGAVATVIAIAHASGVWLESGDTIIKDFMTASYNPFGLDLTQSNLNVDQVFRVTNQLSSRNEDLAFNSTILPSTVDILRADGNGVVINSVPSATYTNTSGTNTIKGLTIASTNAITQNGASGTTDFRALDITTPNITQTAGTITSTGLSIAMGSLTTGGAQLGLNFTGANFTDTHSSTAALNNIANIAFAKSSAGATANSFTIKNLSGSTTYNLFELRDLSATTNQFGGLAIADAFVSKQSYWGDEFNAQKPTCSDASPTTTATTTGTRVGDQYLGAVTSGGTAPIGCAAGSGEFATSSISSAAGGAGSCGYAQNGSNTNGTFVTTATGTASANDSCLIYMSNVNATTLNGILNTQNLPQYTAKVKFTQTASSNNRISFGINKKSVATTNMALADIGYFFSNCTSLTTPTCTGTAWIGHVVDGTTDNTVTCSGTISTTQSGYFRIESRKATTAATAVEVQFFVDNDVSDGIQEVSCGTITTTSTAFGAASNPVSPFMMVGSNSATGITGTVDYMRAWQDDAPDFPTSPTADTSATTDTSTTSTQLTTPPISPDSADPAVAGSFFNFLGNTSEDAVFNNNVFIHGTLYADKIKANEIEGLTVFTDALASLQQKLASNQASTTNTGANGSTSSTTNIYTATTVLNLNDGLVVGGDATFNGNAFFYRLVTFVEKTVFRNDITLGGHVLTDGNPPTVDTEAAAGITTAPSDNPSATLASATIGGNDNSGQLTLNIGDNASTGNLISVKFDKAFAKPPRVLLTASNDQAASLRYYVQTTTNGFSITVIDPPTSGANLLFNYWVVQ